MNNERIKANTSKADMLVLGMLWVQLVLGLLSILVSSTHLDGSVMVQLATWAQSIVILNPTAAAESIESVNIIYKLHIILGLGFFVVFPFTRLVHVVSAPVWYFGRAYQIVRQKREA